MDEKRRTNSKLPHTSLCVLCLILFVCAPSTVVCQESIADIVGIGIAGNDYVYVWYKNGTVSSGTTENLAQYSAPYHYSLPPGKTPEDIVGMENGGAYWQARSAVLQLW